MEESVPAGIHIGNIRLTNLAMEDALDAIDAALAARVRTKIAFVNADCVNICARNPSYARDLEGMDWVFIDGIGMKIAGRMLNQPVRDNVNGTDLFPRLCAEMAARQRRLFLLGASPGVAARAAEWARHHHPGLVIAGAEHGFHPESETPALLDRIRASQADVLLVAMGAPLQESWLARHGDECGTPVCIGVGGLFDYYSGDIPRAPLWMRRTGLEWVFRLLQEPARLWRRYVIGNAVFLLRILRDKFSASPSRNPK
ncbi:MAG: hypothetical protein RLZZ200_413 [Pseudomonadota bacterium]|jgi:N-acetylglucosaminyldiphosphoundecaprenol N-acetyl-beta-D-mannosaminyltransferase